MRISRTFNPSAPWHKLAARFERYIRRRDDVLGLGFTAQEHAAVALFLGLGDIAPHLASEVAEAMGLTRQRAHQLLHSALGKIERQRYPRTPE